MAAEKEKRYLTFRSFRTKETLENGKPLFDTEGSGSITACCEVDRESQSMRVGFSFRNPTDGQLLVRGRGYAISSLKRRSVTIDGLETTDGGNLKVTEALIAHLQSAFSMPIEQAFKHLTVKPYRGKAEKCGLMKWLPGAVQAL